MSGYSDASRQAFKRVNVTAGQEKILAFLRARPNLKPTRGEISQLTGIPINVVCARINELLYDFEQPRVRELAVRDGAHPIELIENATAAPRLSREDSSVPHESSSAPSVASRYVVPHLEHRMSMTLAEAQRGTDLEAQLVRKLRRQFRVWGDDIQFCADVDALIHAPDRISA